MRRLAFLVTLAIGAIPLTGCLYYGAAVRPDHPVVSVDGVTATPEQPAYFSYTPDASIPRVRPLRENPRYSVTKLYFPSRPAFYYKPKHALKAPAVVILPITMGDFYTKALARHLAERGYVCLRFQSRGELLKIRNSPDMLADFERLLRADVIDTLRGVDWLVGQDAVDPQRIGVVGLSLGAIVGSVVMGVDPRINAGAFMLGGGDLAGILFDSDENSIITIRKRIQAQETGPSNAIRQVVASALKNVDPLTYAPRLDPNRVLLISAAFDNVIPDAYGKALWRKMRRPALIKIPTGHYTAGLFFPYAEGQILDHLERVWGSVTIPSEP